MGSCAQARAFAFALIMAPGLAAAAADDAKSPAPVASGVMQESLTGDPSREIVAITLVLPPGADTGLHMHPGDQYTVVQEGEVRVLVEGQPAKVLNILPNVIHATRTRPPKGRRAPQSSLSSRKASRVPFRRNRDSVCLSVRLKETET